MVPRRMLILYGLLEMQFIGRLLKEELVSWSYLNDAHGGDSPLVTPGLCKEWVTIKRVKRRLSRPINRVPLSSITMQAEKERKMRSCHFQ